jgi:S-adenosylmethionine synthetase
MAPASKQYLFTSESVTEGHLTWEATDKADAMRAAAGLGESEREAVAA